MQKGVQIAQGMLVQEQTTETELVTTRAKAAAWRPLTRLGDCEATGRRL